MVLHFASQAKTGFHCVEIFSNDVKIIYLKIKLCVYANWQIFFLNRGLPLSLNKVSVQPESFFFMQIIDYVGRNKDVMALIKS